MLQPTNKISQFWQELKRRKVFRVVAMYAAATYVIIELINNVVEPLSLPEWTPTFIIVLLVIGFPFAVIFSWIFDVTPEGIKKTESAKVARQKETPTKPQKRKQKVSDVIIAMLIVVVGILVYPKIFKKDKFEGIRDADGRVSIAVMPFQNMTNDTIWNVWQDGIKDNLITYLSNYSEDLIVKQIESIDGILQSKGLTNYASITPSVAKAISQKLDANVFISGSITQAGATIRVNAQLINSKTEEAFKSFQIDGTSEEEIFQIIDSISVSVKNFLLISVMEKQIPKDFRQLISTNSSGAYRYYMYGNNAFYKIDFPMAREWYLQSIDIDSNFTEAMRMLSYSCLHMGLVEEAKNWCLRLYKKKDQMSMQEKIWADVLYALYFETPYERIKYSRLLLANDDQMPIPYHLIGGAYNDLQQYDKAIPEFKKELQIYKKWDSRPRWINSYTNLGYVYHQTGQYRKERKLYKKAERDFPDDHPGLIHRQAILSLCEGKTNAANEYIEKYISIRKENSASEAGIKTGLANIYREAGILDKAEDFYRQVLTLEPESPVMMDNLARFLIDNDIDITEGLELVNNALELRPDNYYCLYTKACGLYNTGKYEEALDLLEKSWDARPYYNHDHYLLLQEVEKALANQNK